MVSNLFGKPVTNSTLEGMPEYQGMEMTRFNRAQVAVKRRDSWDRDDALKYVENLKRQSGLGVSSLCLVYNATGDPITFATSHDWYGHIGQVPYPAQIGNGQWAAFLHVKETGLPSGSRVAVVYHGENAVGDNCDWMVSWSTPWNTWMYYDLVCTEINTAYQYYQYGVWGSVYDHLVKSSRNSLCTWNGCYSMVKTGTTTSPIVEALLNLGNAIAPHSCGSGS